eukprot:6005865-Prymnesium_polylepis.2
MAAARPVATKSSYGSKASPMWSAIIWASLVCCAGRQCISNDSVTGSSDVMNDESAIAFATSTNCSTVQKV